MKNIAKLILCVAATSAALLAVAAASKPVSGHAWEYKVVPVQFGPGKKAERELNQLGAEGWELVSDSVTSGLERQFQNHVFVLKREAQ